MFKINQEVRYKVIRGIIGDKGIYHEEFTYPGWIKKIAKTGNLYINYYIEKEYYRDGHHEVVRSRWVKPTEEMENGFIIVKNIPEKPYKPKEIIKSCGNCATFRESWKLEEITPCDKKGCNKDSKSGWIEYIDHDNGSFYFNKD